MLWYWTGLQSSWENSGVPNALADNTDELNELTSGVKLLLYGMVGWLGLLTVASAIIFTIMYVRLDRTYHALEESDACSMTTSGSRRSSILDEFQQNDNKKSSFRFYDSDFDATQSGGTIKVPATDDDCECENGSMPKTIVTYRSAAVHHLNSVTASDSHC